MATAGEHKPAYKSCIKSIGWAVFPGYLEGRGEVKCDPGVLQAVTYNIDRKALVLVVGADDSPL
jgi:hypothetical protein